jgi:Flp pilus assembly pilin Flp
VIKNHFAAYLLNDESGTTAIEYGLAAGLISVVCIGGISLVGAELRTTIYSVVTALILPAL